MLKKRGRPESFDAVKREELTELVKAGQSRHAAAVTLGVAPSTVSKRLRRDPAFAEAVQAAEKFSETDLLAIMRKHCEKSWHATRWLLEITYPERYARRKGNLAAGPSVDEVFDAVVGVLTEEIADESLRTRIEARLDGLAACEFVAAPAAPPRQESEMVENIVAVEMKEEAEEVVALLNEQADEPTNEAAPEATDEVATGDATDEMADEVSDTVAHAMEASQASDEVSLDDVAIEPVRVPFNKPPIANLVKKPSKAGSRPRTAQRKKSRQDKRRRKECDKERKKQQRMKLSAKQAKWRRRR